MAQRFAAGICASQNQLRRPKSNECGFDGGRSFSDWLVEGWEFDEIVVGDAFYGVSGFAPGAQASGDDVDFES